MRHASRPPLVRMMAIDRAVRAGRWPNATALASELEVDPRTIRRDIAYMRDQLGAPLEFDPHRNGYCYASECFQLGFFKVTEGELVALLLARQLFHQYRGTPFEHDLQKAIRKLSELLPETISIQLDTLSACLAVLPSVHIDYNPELFAVLAKAVLESRRIQVVYYTAGRDAETTRTLDPYALFFRDESWYVLARDSLRDDLRVFAVQRFRQAQETGEGFVRPDDFQIGAYLSGSFGVVRGEEHHRVSLRFRPPSARRVSERCWQPGQSIEHLPDGRLILRFEVNDLREVQRWVLSWGADCEVLEPEELRTRFREELALMMQQHASDP